MKKTRRRRTTRTETTAETAAPITLEPRRQRWMEVCFIVILILFGAYLSILYFGHERFPSSDFISYTGVAHRLLDFELPASWKRLPVLGLLQVGLSRFIGGPHPELTAGWLLNAILYPLNAVLFFLLARRVVGPAAVWIAIAAVVNPWTLKWMRQPILETTLVFFTLLTFVLMTRRSKWAYLAGLLASLTRFEGAVLLVIVYAWDFLELKQWRRRFARGALAAVAMLPVVLWGMGEALSYKPGSMGYMEGYRAGIASGNIVMVRFLRMMWQCSIGSFFVAFSQGAQRTLAFLGQFAAAVGVLSALVHAVWRRFAPVLAIAAYVAAYTLLHGIRDYTEARYVVPIAWLVLLLIVFGLQSLWRTIAERTGAPRWFVGVMQGVLILIAGLWAAALAGKLPKLTPLSVRSASVPLVAGAAVLTVFAVRRAFYRYRHLLADLAAAAVLVLFVVSNQFFLVREIGNGTKDAEFREMAEWFAETTAPGETLATTLAHVVTIFAPDRAQDFVQTQHIPGETLEEFTRAAAAAGVQYVAWDSRLGLNPRDQYYQRWKIPRLQPLSRPADVGPWEFVRQFRINDRHFINVFRLRMESLP